MNRENLKLVVIPSGVQNSFVDDYTPELDGKVFSTMTDIKVNKVPDGYSILYYSDDIKNMDMNILSNNIIKLFLQNVPDTIIDFKIEYFYDISNYDEGYTEIDLGTVNNLLTLEARFFNMSQDPNGVFKYVKSNSMIKLVNSVINHYKEIDDDNDPVRDYFESLGIVDTDEDDDDTDIIGYKNKSKPKKSYPQSKILKESKNAKRAYNRHGVIICNDKKARKQDEKIIKEFLKDFIPGDADWKKEFRHDILKRWMKMYSISKSDLKELEKAHNKARKSKDFDTKVEKTLEFTSRLFNRTGDHWNDPNR